MKWNKIISIIQGIVAVGILLLLFGTLDYKLAYTLFTTLDLRLIALAGICYFLNNLLVGYRIKEILAEMGENIRLRLALYSHMAGMLLSDFTPGRAGYLYTAYALNKRDIPMEKGLATITSSYLYDLTFKMLTAIIGIYFLYSFVFADKIGFAIIVTILAIIGVIIGYFIIMHPGDWIRALLEKWELSRKLLSFGDQSRAIQKHAGFILSITAIGWVLRGLEWYLILLAMHQTVLTAVDAFLLSPLLTLFSLIPLTPAGWGLQEAGIVLVFTLLGTTATFAASFALITRLLEVGVDLLGLKELFVKPKENESLIFFYNTIEGDVDDEAYNSDLLVQRYFQRRKTGSIINMINIKKTDVIIDIGCGSGVQIQEIGKEGYAYAVGIDVNVNAVRFAKEKCLPDTEFIVADAQHLPIKSDSIDKIVCAEIIEHLKNPEYLVAEVKRVLKTGGAIVITTPNDRSVWGFYEILWDIFGRGRNYGETHLRFFSIDGLKQSFAQFSEFKARTILFISPLIALIGHYRLLYYGVKFDIPFEQRGMGVLITMYARK